MRNFFGQHSGPLVYVADNSRMTYLPNCLYSTMDYLSHDEFKAQHETIPTVRRIVADLSYLPAGYLDGSRSAQSA